MIHRYRVKLTDGVQAIVDGRLAIPVSIYMAAGTVTGASGVSPTVFGPPVPITATAGSVSPITQTELAEAPWYQFNPTGGGGCVIMQERIS